MLDTHVILFQPVTLMADPDRSFLGNVHLCTFSITVASHGPHGGPRGQGRTEGDGFQAG